MLTGPRSHPANMTKLSKEWARGKLPQLRPFQTQLWTRIGYHWFCCEDLLTLNWIPPVGYQGRVCHCLSSHPDSHPGEVWISRCEPALKAVRLKGRPMCLPGFMHTHRDLVCRRRSTLVWMAIELTVAGQDLSHEIQVQTEESLLHRMLVSQHCFYRLKVSERSECAM